MKEETKKKLCKISKIVGFAITFGFAVFGALCAAMLIGNGSKKDDIKTLDNSFVLNEVRSERISKPRKAPDYVGGVNILDDPDMSYKRDYSNFVFSSPFTINFGGQGANDSIALTDKLPKGYYYVSTDNPWFALRDYTYFNSIKVRIQNSGNDTFVIADNQYNADFAPYLSYSGGYLYSDGNLYFFGRSQGAKVYLVDTLDVPAKNVVNFPSNWSPLSLISDNLSIKGGYAFVDVSPATYQTLVPITISLKQNLFRYDGKVYDEMVFTFVDLSHGDGYIQDDGQPWKPWEKTTSQLSSSLHVFGLYSLRFNASFNGDSIVALSPIYSDSPFQTGGDGTYYPPTVYLPTGEYRWVNPKVTYVEFLDTSFGSVSSRYDGRYSDYSDLDLLIYLNGFLSEGNYLSVGASGGVFDLMSGAFNGLLPILNVQVLPNITLGILLFLPLIGAIIVIIIRVVKK